MDDFKIFTDLLGSLIAKYVEKIDLDNLPDVPQHIETTQNSDGFDDYQRRCVLMKGGCDPNTAMDAAVDAMKKAMSAQGF